MECGLCGRPQGRSATSRPGDPQLSGAGRSASTESAPSLISRFLSFIAWTAVRRDRPSLGSRERGLASPAQLAGHEVRGLDGLHAASRGSTPPTESRNRLKCRYGQRQLRRVLLNPMIQRDQDQPARRPTRPAGPGLPAPGGWHRRVRSMKLRRSTDMKPPCKGQQQGDQGCALARACLVCRPSRVTGSEAI